MAEAGARAKVRAALDEMLDSQNAGDAERFRSTLSERLDAVHIGSDSSEWWTSKEVVDAVAGADDDIMVVADDIDVHVQVMSRGLRGAGASRIRVAMSGRYG